MRTDEPRAQVGMLKPVRRSVLKKHPLLRAASKQRLSVIASVDLRGKDIFDLKEFCQLLYHIIIAFQKKESLNTYHLMLRPRFLVTACLWGELPHEASVSMRVPNRALHLRRRDGRHRAGQLPPAPRLKRSWRCAELVVGQNQWYHFGW